MSEIFNKINFDKETQLTSKHHIYLVTNYGFVKVFTN